MKGAVQLLRKLAVAWPPGKPALPGFDAYLTTSVVPVVLSLVARHGFDPARLQVHQTLAEVAGLLAAAALANGAEPFAAYLQAQVLPALGVPPAMAADLAQAVAALPAAPLAKHLKPWVVTLRAALGAV